MGQVDAGRTPPTAGCRTRETEWEEERRSLAQGDSLENRLVGAATEGSGRPPARRSQEDAGEEDAARPRVDTVFGGSCETRSGRPAQRGRPAHVEGAA